jgi:hypothetical protein
MIGGRCVGRHTNRRALVSEALWSTANRCAGWLAGCLAQVSKLPCLLRSFLKVAILLLLKASATCSFNAVGTAINVPLNFWKQETSVRGGSMSVEVTMCFQMLPLWDKDVLLNAWWQVSAARGVNEVCALLGCYAAWIGSYLQRFWDKLSSPDSPRTIRESFPTQLLTDYIWIRSNKMQQYAGIYLLQNHSICFGCPSHPSSGVHKTVTAASGTGRSTWVTTFLQRNLIKSRGRKVVTQILWHVPEAAVTVLCTPDDGCDGHPKHIEWFCSK